MPDFLIFAFVLFVSAYFLVPLSISLALYLARLLRGVGTVGQEDLL